MRCSVLRPTQPRLDTPPSAAHTDGIPHAQQLGGSSAERLSPSQRDGLPLAELSHELRSPLNAIIGLSEMLAEGLCGELNDKQRQYVLDIRSSGHQLLTLVDELLELERAAMDDELQCLEFKCSDVLERVVALLREHAIRRRVALNLDIGDGNATVAADPNVIKRVVFDLVHQVLRTTEQGGSVSIAAVERADSVEISVRNGGAANVDLAFAGRLLGRHNVALYGDDSEVRFALPRAR